MLFSGLRDLVFWLDAAEWVGPYDDEKLGSYKIAPHHYYPGWWKSNSMNSFYVNSKTWDALPEDYQAAFEAAAAEANGDMMTTGKHCILLASCE